MASLKFDCSLCGQSLEAELDMAGSNIQCPHCNGSIRVPSSAPLMPVSTTSATAVWSFVLSLFSLFCFGLLTSIPAIICGHVSVSKINQSRGRLTGKGLAVAGLVIGYLSTILWLGVVIFFECIARLDN